MPHRDDFDDDLMDPSSEAYDYKPVSSNEGGGSKVVKLFTAVTVVAAIAGGAWYFVGGMKTSSDNIPVVRADSGPTKLKPSEPGGMEVPNRDKTVYERVSGENTEPKLERLLPRPEQPLEKPKAGMALPELPEKSVEQGDQPVVSKELPVAALEEAAVEPAKQVEPETMMEAVQPAMPDTPSQEMAEEISAPPPAPVVDENAPRALVKRDAKPIEAKSLDQDALAAKIADALNETAEEVEEEPVKPVAVAKVEPKVVETPKPVIAEPQTGYAIQLLSSKNKAGVEKTWDTIKAKNADIVKGLPSNIVKADLGEKGVYYRLRLGPVPTGNQAKEICGQLKQRDVGCFIVRIR